jgi:glucokinase
MAHCDLVLAGDIGGTKTSLALFAVHGDKLHVESPRTFPSKRYSGLVPVLQDYLAGEQQKIDAACFGIAGPVVDGKVKTPNLPWRIDTAELRRALKLESVTLLNDLEAAAYGIFTLENDEFFPLNEGAIRQSGNKALIAAGTGLGQAILHDDGRQFHPLASEGGHADFAPRNDLEIELLRYLIGRLGHVSYERVLSGPGLFNVYLFLKESRSLQEPEWLMIRARLFHSRRSPVKPRSASKAWTCSCRSTALKRAISRCARSRCGDFTLAEASRRRFLPN